MNCAVCRKAECFVQLVNLLNVDCESDVGSQLCFKVLQTLTALLSGNEASRIRMRDDIGYDTLFSIISRLLGSQAPSQQLLMQLLSLTLEVHNPLNTLGPFCEVLGDALSSENTQEGPRRCPLRDRSLYTLCCSHVLDARFGALSTKLGMK